ncbi:phosphoribosylanthranilate isomerase [Henriciella barbarensis]|uniref:N-(5'-phosphoribosyl)anthranilate isomerase n=1 Tax=Henriciella barbarensis TaxID=86342 RepID=A0A399QYL9_9PROT|nr:phosphoribosylanthranilate isomerase [Henriciella barbarensis]RIJ24010.1 phosphoribosylanthranilate isomerase [Henriciella barbarensis]
MADVKICGISDADMVKVAAEAGADWVGFVLVPQSPRNVLGSTASRFELVIDLLLAAATNNVRSVVLVSDPEPAILRGVGGTVMPDVFQLHGKESPEFVANFRASLPSSVEVWKAVGVSSREDLEEAARLYRSADRLLIDAKPPEGADRTGGHGAAFDWSILQDWAPATPWLLAGGLTPHNVAGAIKATGAPAVDVSSGVERQRGIKDADLVRAFIAAAKSQDYEGSHEQAKHMGTMARREGPLRRIWRALRR